MPAQFSNCSGLLLLAASLVAWPGCAGAEADIITWVWPEMSGSVFKTTLEVTQICFKSHTVIPQCPAREHMSWLSVFIATRTLAWWAVSRAQVSILSPPALAPVDRCVAKVCLHRWCRVCRLPRKDNGYTSCPERIRCRHMVRMLLCILLQ